MLLFRRRLNDFYYGLLTIFNGLFNYNEYSIKFYVNLIKNIIINYYFYLLTYIKFIWY